MMAPYSLFNSPLVSVMPDSTAKLIDLALGNSTSFSDFLNNTEKISPPGLSSPPIRTEGTNEMSVGQSPFKVDMSNWLQGEVGVHVLSVSQDVGCAGHFTLKLTVNFKDFFPIRRDCFYALFSALLFQIS
jgi:hypothetical protein